MDTNPVGEGWTVDPWGGIVKDDNCIYGIGVSNMKAGCAAYLCAVRTLVKAGWKLKGNVIRAFAASPTPYCTSCLRHADYMRQ